MIELFYIGIPVVRTDGLSGGRAVYGHVITIFSRMGRLLLFLTRGAPLARLARESSALKIYIYISYNINRPLTIKLEVRSQKTSEGSEAGPSSPCRLATGGL